MSPARQAGPTTETGDQKMNNDQYNVPSNGVAGRPGTSVRVGEDWVGWSGIVAHPDSPLGSGGPGGFSPRFPLNADSASDLPSSMQPGPLGAVPLDAPAAAPKPAPKPANPAPTTTVESLGVQKEVQSDLVDYKIEAEVVADGTGGVTTGADTSFTKIASTAPEYDADGGKITKFKGKFTFKGTIRIETKYAADSNANSLSCYGRGTTDTDVANRDISLGFHESCHRADYKAYLSANKLPDPPAMSIGMKATDYDKAAAAFSASLTKYWADMTADSIKKTDDVGFTLKKSNQTNSCFVHILP